MPSSMTAFARQTIQADWGTATWEIRSVNHRFLEMGFRMPETVRDIEMELRNIGRNQLQRGKVDSALQLRMISAEGSVDIDADLAEQYIDASQRVAQLMDNPATVSPLDILQWPGVLKEPDVDLEQLKKDLLSLYRDTVKQLAEGRRREGEKLKGFIQQRLDAIGAEVAKVRKVLPELISAQKQKIQDRLKEVTAELDNDRLEQELVYIAQKADVDEELDRLVVHLEEIGRALDQRGPVGRRLDFLMQELNREANTLASKSIASDTTQSAVELKVLIEQIREQIQNIE